MKKYRKAKYRKLKRVKRHRTKRLSSKQLRAGSKNVKAQLLEQNPYCDICGSEKTLQLHHVYLIRHGFETKLERCVLLCPTCHCAFHARWDKYLDIAFRENPEMDFKKLYNVLKTL